jgi:hypothetical protein
MLVQGPKTPGKVSPRPSFFIWIRPFGPSISSPWLVGASGNDSGMRTEWLSLTLWGINMARVGVGQGE